MQAYMLHSRPYRESSRLVTWVTEEFGRLESVVRMGRSKKQVALLPFMPYEIQVRGTADLRAVYGMEPMAQPLLFKDDRLYCAMYLNELLFRLLHPYAVHEGLFALYSDTLSQLAITADVEKVLRIFEITLLELLGYGFSFDIDADTGEMLDPELEYRVLPEQGLVRRSGVSGAGQALVYAGKILLEISRLQLENTDTRKAAKTIMRQLLAIHLGGKMLLSRNLFLH